MISTIQQPERLSKLLPSVKCSTCLCPVPISQLGEHTCQPIPQLPRASSIAIPTPSTTTPPVNNSSPNSIPRPRVQGLPSTPRLITRPPTRTDDVPRASPSPRPSPTTSHPRRPGFPASTNSIVSKNVTPPPPPPPQGHSTPSPRLPFPPVRTPNTNTNLSGEAFIPPLERGIDTSSGGVAGMAGVGRRGFAAAARAAMFVAQPPPRHMGPAHLDLYATPRHATETPPLSAGSGYSSHSPGPMSPLPQPDSQQPALLYKPPAVLTPPGLISNSPAPVSFNNNNNKVPDKEPQSLPKDIIAYMRGPRSQSSGSTSAGASSASKGGVSAHSSAESQYSGLAYAASTDYEDDADERRGRTLTSPRGAPLKEAILRTIANNSRVQFGSVSERSRSRSDDGANRASRYTTSALKSEAQMKTDSIPVLRSHSRASSISSSYSSNAASDHFVRTRSNSSVVAHALGLSQTPPSKYAKLGGPGAHNLARSASGRSEVGQTPTVTEEKKEKLATTASYILDPPKLITKQGSGSAASSSSGLSHGLRDRARDEADGDIHLNLGNKVKAQRSRTVQGVVPVQSPDLKSVKLPTRALSEREKEKSSEGKNGSPKKDRVLKSMKVCLKCAITIENGRWVLMDGGGVLCERCWKNMYLPKCRRCNLPIDKQAVSSADGQLKGKYHKDCFNCHECHRPFPDKTFYVYDGKPLCAYHYHEANDSLCASSQCGQPIEGPCAVSHSGDRYHPEHMTCEYAGGIEKCGERLREYWDVDGRMLCERHAVMRNGSRDGDMEERWGDNAVGRKKGLKRITRFIDLAGGGGIGNTLASRGETTSDGLR